MTKEEMIEAIKANFKVAFNSNRKEQSTFFTSVCFRYDETNHDEHDSDMDFIKTCLEDKEFQVEKLEILLDTGPWLRIRGTQKQAKEILEDEQNLTFESSGYLLK